MYTMYMYRVRNEGRESRVKRKIGGVFTLISMSALCANKHLTVAMQPFWHDMCSKQDLVDISSELGSAP